MGHNKDKKEKQKIKSYFESLIVEYLLYQIYNFMENIYEEIIFLEL